MSTRNTVNKKPDGGKINGQELANDLNLKDHPHFGVCFSILTWGATVKSSPSESSPSDSYWSWAKKWAKKTVNKLFENGHATTFLINGDNMTQTIIYDETPESDSKCKRKYQGKDDDEEEEDYSGWCFESDTLKNTEWARKTSSTYTYVYYKKVDSAFVNKYNTIKAELEGRVNKTRYSEWKPNIRCDDIDYQNCISHCYYLMYKLGLVSWVKTKGLWMPSMMNRLEWWQNFLSDWKYKCFNNTNTHIPGEDDDDDSEEE